MANPLFKVPLIGSGLRRLANAMRVPQSRALFPSTSPADRLLVDTPAAWEGDHIADRDALERAFGDIFRGSSEFISAHVAQFVEPMERASRAVPARPLVDVGCGRGDLLKLLADRGLPCIGVDANPQQVEGLAELGFDVAVGYGNEYLAARPPSSLAGISSIAVAEHLDSETLLAFLREAKRTIAPGGCLIIETSNPQCIFELAQFWLDPSHVRFYHPLTLAFYVAQSGFRDVKILNSFPAPFSIRANGDDNSLYQAYAIVATRAGLER